MLGIDISRVPATGRFCGIMSQPFDFDVGINVLSKQRNRSKHRRAFVPLSGCAGKRSRGELMTPLEELTRTSERRNEGLTELVWGRSPRSLFSPSWYLVVIEWSSLSHSACTSRFRCRHHANNNGLLIYYCICALDIVLESRTPNAV